MPEVRLNIDDAFYESLKEATGITKPSQLTSDALNLFKWAANEARAGRELITEKPDGSDRKRIIVPSIENLKKHNR